MDRIKPMLGDVELQQVQQLDIDADQIWTEHEIPGLESDFFQSEGRRGSLITVAGVITGLTDEQAPDQPEDASPAAKLQALREKFRAAEPVTFVSDIISATDLDEVLIEDMEITEVAGKPNRFEYAFRLREFTAPPAEPVEPPPVEPPPQQLTATLVVDVTVESDPGFDFSRVTVSVEGTTEEGASLSRTLINRDNNVWTEEDFPPGQYTARAIVNDSAQMEDSRAVEVRDGETATVSLVLRQGAALAKSYMIHFRFDSAFVEPCMMHVLRQVAAHAGSHGSEHFLILGHTDLAGSVDYNQSLSERRARTAFSALRFGNDNQAAIDEWNAIRRTRNSGVSLGDSWGTREYQQMLQDLGFYKGRIDGQHGPGTDASVTEFQTQNPPLTPNGNVDDATWPVLIGAYLGKYDLSVADSQFLPNCSGEFLKWLGCSELDPVRDVTFAWRPNRRTEFLFVNDTSLPADVREPATFNLPAAGAVNSGWCLNPGNVTSRACYVKPHVPPGKESCTPNREPWTRQPAEPQPVFEVKGSIRFSDGTPYVGRYTLIAPDGEFMDGEVPTSTSSQRAGTGIRGTTQADGSFSYPDVAKHKRPGIFTLEIDGDFVIRRADEPIEEAKGPVTCKRLASASDSFDVIVVPAALASIIPSITAPDVVVVKKPHTSPQRQPVTLQVGQAFTGTGTFDCSERTRVAFFTAAAGGTPLQFDGVDNVFTDVQLLAGVTLFAEGGPDPSAALDDVELSLLLMIGTQSGHVDTEQMTSVLVTLDIASSQTTPAGGFQVLSAADKINPGRRLQVQNTQFQATRGLVVARRTIPEAFTGNLVLQPINNRVRLFDSTQQIPAAGQIPQVFPVTIPNQGVAAGPNPPVATDLTGQQFWAEAASVSNAVADTGFQLGIEGLEPDGDRVMVTATQVLISNNIAPFDTAQTRVQIEGILHRLRTSFDVGDLVNSQANSLFRPRVTIPGIAGNTVQATLESRDMNGALIENHPVTLTRTTGNAFVPTMPILAISHNFPRADITFTAPQDIAVVRCQAQGSLRLRLDAPNTDAGAVQVNVLGRVLQLCTVAIQGASPTLNTDLATANRVMAQGGIEFRVLGSSTVNNPALLDVQIAACNSGTPRSAEETTLYALGRAGCANNFLIYFVRSTTPSLAGCAAHPPGQFGAIVTDNASQYSFGHEIGHVLSLPHDARTNNLMTGSGTFNLPAQNNLVRLEDDQLQSMDNSGLLAFLE